MTAPLNANDYAGDDRRGDGSAGGGDGKAAPGRSSVQRDVMVPTLDVHLSPQ